MRVLALVVALSDIVLAAWVFVFFARPEGVIGLIAPLAGLGRELDEGRLSELDERRLMCMARRLRWPLAVVLFAWSFLCGAVLSWARGGGL